MIKLSLPTEQFEEGEETTTDPTRTFEDNPDLFK
jgi:hypothetical protein